MSMRHVHMYLNVMRNPKYDDANFSSARSIYTVLSHLLKHIRIFDILKEIVAGNNV
ncbi:hypothetical protein Bandiella_01068 [Candidatus Bandiella woodruffii]|uniref:Uncharacterized protein n=1 Tax=Candidatus Bandiella euplotis TaxID=1664265 RepID=A0ABZ0UN33_9RICK|nr:hypothetical protein Bandiella_01068 [Candidatus Bandiella woodruffii]